MTNKGLSKIGLRILDRVTDRFPSFGSKAFQRSFVTICGSSGITDFFVKRYRKQWLRAKAILEQAKNDCRTCKIAVIPDVCIGDAVLMSECLTILRDLFPDAETHYVCNRTGGLLIEGMPGVTIHPIITGEHGFPTRRDIELLHALAEVEQFQIVLNFGPFLERRSLPQSVLRIDLYVPLAAFVLQAWKENSYRHISYLSRTFLSEFLGHGRIESNSSTLSLNSNSVYLSNESILKAQVFFDNRHLTKGTGIVFWNPDATSKFGTIPIALQSDILRQIASLNEVSALLIGRAYSNREIERELLASLPEPFLKKVHLVPHMPIEDYTAIIDACDMYISGDTGPLHIASCRKFSMSGIPLRNRTAVVAIYGATDSRMYGYDSEQPFHSPANQDVPSRSFSGSAPCRNISCINKFGKSCAEVRCFDHLPTTEIVQHVSTYCKNLSRAGLSTMRKPIAITIPQEREYAL